MRFLTLFSKLFHRHTSSNSCKSLELVYVLRRGAIASLSAFSVMVVGVSPALTQSVMEDSTQGTQAIPQGQGNFLIDGGTSGGETNLFHSFERFSVRDGAEVRFLRGNEFENIIGRVTGNDLSTINGTLSVDGNANLFLMNPNGITFGENAQLNLSGSFLATTADEIRFDDQGSFSAFSDDVPVSELNIDPSALVFNQISSRPEIGDREIIVSSGDREVIDTAIDNGTFPDLNDNNASPNLNDIGGLNVRGGRSIVLAGGPVNIDGGILRVPQGFVELAAFAGEGELPLSINRRSIRINRGILNDNDGLADINLTDVNIDDESLISLSNGAVIDVTGRNNGDITIISREDIAINGGSICGGIGPSFACSLLPSDDSTLEQLRDLEAFGDNNSTAGNIVLLASGDILISGGSKILNAIYPNSEAQGQETSRDRAPFQNNELQIVSDRDISGIDNLFGSIILDARNILLDGEEGTAISTSTLGQGNAGLIFLSATDFIEIIGATVDPSAFRPAQISSSSDGINPGDEGDAGAILMGAGQVNLRNLAGITTSAGGEENVLRVGNPGNIIIVADDNPSTFASNDGQVNLFDGSIIASNVERRSDGGAIAGQDALRELDIETVANSSDVRTLDEGSIIVIANEVNLSNGSEIQTIVRGMSNTDTDVGRGDGGTIFIVSENLFLDNSRLFSSVGTNAIGDGGLIFVIARDVGLSNGATFNVETFGAGGLITRTQQNAIADEETPESTGGTVFLVALNDLGLIQGSQVTASANGDNRAGNIIILTDQRQVLQGNSSIEADTDSGEGGNIFSVGNSIFLFDNSNISTEAGDNSVGGGGSGGNIDLNVNLISASPINNSNINAEAYDGPGGRIDLGFVLLQTIAEREEVIPSNDISASSELGADGFVLFNALDFDPAKRIFELPELVVDVDSLLVQSCPGPGQRDANELGSLSIVGREGIPPSTSDRPGTDDLFASWVNVSDPLDNNLAIEHEPSPIIELGSSPPVLEGQDLITDVNGDLWLVADASNPRYPVPPSSAACPHS